MLRFCLALGLTVLLANSLRAQQPQPLPSPRPFPPQFVPAQPIFYPRVSQYEVWQYYGVDRQGYFRPRVVPTPLGSAGPHYYLGNGKFYPWVDTHQRSIMPYALD